MLLFTALRIAFKMIKEANLFKLSMAIYSIDFWEMLKDPFCTALVLDYSTSKSLPHLDFGSVFLAWYLAMIHLAMLETTMMQMSAKDSPRKSPRDPPTAPVMDPKSNKTYSSRRSIRIS